jgi:hypothetical protein
MAVEYLHRARPPTAHTAARKPATCPAAPNIKITKSGWRVRRWTVRGRGRLPGGRRVAAGPGGGGDARRRVAVGHDRLAGILTRMRTGAAEESRRWIMTKRAASGPSLVRFDSPAGREALCDRCAPTHAAAKVAASGHTYWSERRTTRTASPTWRTTSLTVKCSPGLCGRAKGAGQQHSRWSEP